MEYADEPRLIFSPLTEEDYCDFYDLEMRDFSDDSQFYRRFLAADDKVLELGCGSGRLTRLLACHCQSVCGVDISPQMIQRAQKQQTANITYHLADMTTVCFDTKFDAVIIPYNTLNLLNDQEKIGTCLQLCRSHLQPSGKLLLHLYLPDRKMRDAADEKFFQFSIHQRRDGGKIIKETLKSYDTGSQTVTLEERYRVRPPGERSQYRDLKHVLSLYAPPLDTWRNLLSSTGLSLDSWWGDFDLSDVCPVTGTSLLIHASPVK